MKKALYGVALLVIILPMFLIGYITYLEMQEYQPNIDYTIGEKSYTIPVEITRETLEENIVLKGSFTSNSNVFITISNSSSRAIRLEKSIGDEVSKGDVLAYIKDKPVTSTCNGIVTEIDIYSTDGYIKLLDLDNLLFETYVDSKGSLNVGEKYEVDGTIKITMVALSKVIDENGRKAYFKVEGGDFLYGQATEFCLYTGTVFNDILAVPQDCVYQKETGGPYYIRRVTSNGTVLEEVEVKVGISSNKMVSITRAEAGWFCDQGYAKLMNASIGH
jgi:hypothetical protein